MKVQKNFRINEFRFNDLTNLAAKYNLSNTEMLERCIMAMHILENNSKIDAFSAVEFRDWMHEL